MNTKKLKIFTPTAPLKTAVLFLIYKRLDTARRVFEVIRAARPPRLYIASDGPRESKEGEAEKVQAVRDYVMSHIDWDCEVKTLFREKNLGCKYAVSGAISWFFENEEMGIILEDDCLPSMSFFWFCEELLDKYKDDERIVNITGCNFQQGRNNTGYSYYFSIYSHIWGWAGWRRAWKHYDADMKLWPAAKKEGLLEDLFKNKGAIRYWETIFDRVYNQRIDTWDYQLLFSCWIQGGLTVVPNANLISNIGFGKEAVHTIDSGDKFFDLPTDEIEFPLRHPPRIVQHIEADEFTQKNMFGSYSPLTRWKYALRKVLSRLRSQNFRN